MEGQHYILGNIEGIPLYLKPSGPIDFSQDYEWSESPENRVEGTFEEMCEILDEYFVHGEFNSISGIISPVDAEVRI